VASCTLHGMVAVGEYIVGSTPRAPAWPPAQRRADAFAGSNRAVPCGADDASATAAALLVVKVIDLQRPVRNLGGSEIFADSWHSLLDADAAADVWRTSGFPGCAAVGSAPALAGAVPSVSGVLVAPNPKKAPAPRVLLLQSECSLVGRPHEVRTLNFFRHRLRLAIDGISLERNAIAHVAMQVPTSDEMNSTGWPQARHYLPLVEVKAPGHRHTAQDVPRVVTASAAGSAAGISVAVAAAGSVMLVETRVTGGQARTLATGQLPPGCCSAAVHASCRLEVTAGSVFTASDRIQEAPPGARCTAVAKFIPTRSCQPLSP